MSFRKSLTGKYNTMTFSPFLAGLFLLVGSGWGISPTVTRDGWRGPRHIQAYSPSLPARPRPPLTGGQFGHSVPFALTPNHC